MLFFGNHRMSESPEITRYFNAAMSPDEENQLKFASNISTVMAPFQSAWITSQFIPFLSVWLPRNNEQITTAICKSLSEIIAKAGSLSSVAPLIEALISSEKPSIMDSIENTLKAYNKPPQVDELITILVKSFYDVVRCFVTRILPLSNTDSFKVQITSQLCSDPSFAVRLAISKFVPELPEKDAFTFASILINDTHPRIRASLPFRFGKSPFFITELAPLLVKDPDWSVRACLCSQLPNVSINIPQACEIARQLIDDSV